MRLLVTGASGMLGHEVVDVMGDEDLLPVDIAGDCMHLDITDCTGVRKVVAQYQPDLIMHLAAYTDVDGCQTNPEQAWRVNAAGTWNLATAACENDTAMLYISTDFVFDGNTNEPYDEFSPTHPLSVYGRTKLAGEVFVRSLVRRHYIVRTSWLYGVHGKCFPGNMIKYAKEGKALRIVGDQIGSPTYAVDLAKCIKQIVYTSLYGTYHVSNTGECSWYDLAKTAIELYGLQDAELSKITSEEWPTPTKRPMYSVLKHQALELAGIPETRQWREALADYVESYKSFHEGAK